MPILRTGFSVCAVSVYHVCAAEGLDEDALVDTLVEMHVTPVRNPGSPSFFTDDVRASLTPPFPIL